jgi:hypothetical protein
MSLYPLERCRWMIFVASLLATQPTFADETCREACFVQNRMKRDGCYGFCHDTRSCTPQNEECAGRAQNEFERCNRVCADRESPPPFVGIPAPRRPAAPAPSQRRESRAPIRQDEAPRRVGTRGSGPGPEPTFYGYPGNLTGPMPPNSIRRNADGSEVTTGAPTVDDRDGEVNEIEGSDLARPGSTVEFDPENQDMFDQIRRRYAMERCSEDPASYAQIFGDCGVGECGDDRQCLDNAHYCADEMLAACVDEVLRRPN